MENATITRLALTSDSFRDGEPIPAQFTCDGADETPALRWGEPPAGTKGFAVVIDDPDAPSGTLRHWGVFDIPASARSIGGGERLGTEVANDFGNPGYGGPCPPEGDHPHRYFFTVHAVSMDKLPVTADTAAAVVGFYLNFNTLAKAALMGLYKR